MTDLGLMKETGVLSLRFRVSFWGKLRPGMYWYLAVLRVLTRWTRSTMAPT